MHDASLCRYKFRSTWLLRLAVLHTSAIHKSPAPTLPLLGDSVLQLIIVEQLSAMYPTASAGDLTVAKCKLCSREECRACAPPAEHVPLSEAPTSDIIALVLHGPRSCSVAVGYLQGWGTHERPELTAVICSGRAWWQGFAWPLQGRQDP